MLYVGVGHSNQISEEDVAQELIEQCRDSMDGEEIKAGLFFVSYGLQPPDFVGSTE